MKTKVSELAGAQLDYWVAKADGRDVEIIDQGENPVSPRYYARLKPTGAVWWPSTHWSQGGPIIEREVIDLSFSPQYGYVEASIFVHGPGPGDVKLAGQAKAYSPLVAAMRAYVASKFGEEVEVPA